MFIKVSFTYWRALLKYSKFEDALRDEAEGSSPDHPLFWWLNRFIFIKLHIGQRRHVPGAYGHRTIFLYGDLSQRN